MLVTRKLVPVSGVSRSCGKIIFEQQKNLLTNLKLVPSSERYINTGCCLMFSKPYTREKLKDMSNQKTVKINIQKLEETENGKIEKTSSIKDREKKDLPMETEVESEQQKEKRKDKRWRAYGRQLILSSFESAESKNKESFLECLRMYTNSPGKKVDRILFIYAALKYMEEFEVHKDLEIYKAILDILPKGSMVPTNVFQTWFMHYPKEQYCAVALLEQMEDNSVMPDPEMESMLLNIFSSHGLPTQKYWKMMYWMPKFKNLNPWPVPKPIPNDPFELAKLAMVKISSIDVQSVVSVFDTHEVEDSIDKTWIVSAMAPKQSELLRKHDKSKAIYVEGPYRIYVATKSVDYFILRADPAPNRKYPDVDTDAVDRIRNPYLEATTSKDIIVVPSVHEEVDATIFAICATGTSSKDTLLSWVRCLQRSNPVLGELAIVFTLKNVAREGYYIEEGHEYSSRESKDS
ncbi:evolutionarily conserved signaling intermediate in Toll pathway, mitochondrial [Copidosoma floridanum]|uniref:evolutionarily conserved signaling intermediate in Toll pathway, mitochondrial n=1 Tax=Copidosoma floridanum TaxID=29053 RepID=UPI0006C9C178|nr:evolutionarily conserved signaling intermediate in Toll pathway, mitochondrial [Copidosoma floridanum]